MYYYVSGQVAHVEPYLAVIDCGGVGYACRTTAYTISQIKKGDRAKLFTYLSVREDAMDLYGFFSQEELKLFQQLISVSGVGPKAALAILSSSTPANLAMSIITGDEKTLTRAPGVGKKIAQRVILELKDKLKLEDAFELKRSHEEAALQRPEGGKDGKSEAVQALAALGYSASEAMKAVNRVEGADGLSVEELLKEALRRM